jgi:hypothetical protein
MVTSNEEKIIVFYNGEEYDATTFVDSHPAGRDIIVNLKGKDITSDFDDTGHSAAAKKILNKLKVKKESDNESLLNQYKTRDGLSIDAKYLQKKLFTKEDEYFIHKFFGFFALISFFYRYFYVLPTTGTLGFTGSALDLATLLVHFFLSFTSLIFHVVAHRIIERPLIIYEEYRMHAILFTTRCLFVSLIGIYCNDWDPILRRYILGAALVAIHLAVDYTTTLYGTPGVTAVRNHKSMTFKYLGYFYSYYQIAAVASHIIWSDKLGDLGYNTLIAIQSSAFLMTLKRKNIIRWYTHAFWYSVALACSYYYMWVARGSMFFVYAALAFFIRVNFNVNKYILWTAYAFGIYYLLDSKFELPIVKF